MLITHSEGRSTNACTCHSTDGLRLDTSDGQRGGGQVQQAARERIRSPGNSATATSPGHHQNARRDHRRVWYAPRGAWSSGSSRPYLSYISALGVRVTLVNLAQDPAVVAQSREARPASSRYPARTISSRASRPGSPRPRQAPSDRRRPHARQQRHRGALGVPARWKTLPPGGLR